MQMPQESANNFFLEKVLSVDSFMAHAFKTGKAAILDQRAVGPRQISAIFPSANLWIGVYRYQSMPFHSESLMWRPA